ncbi:hypothetical protein D9M72_530110 [compost metagenome]
MAKSKPSAAMSTRLLLVERRTSMNGYLAWKSASRGNSQPTAKVPTAPIISTSRMCPASKRSSMSAIRSKESRSTGSNASPSAVIISPRGNRLNRVTFSRLSSSFTWWLTAACVTQSSIAARVKLKCRADASKARSALSGRYGLTMYALTHLMGLANKRGLLLGHNPFTVNSIG